MNVPCYLLRLAIPQRGSIMKIQMTNRVMPKTTKTEVSLRAVKKCIFILVHCYFKVQCGVGVKTIPFITRICLHYVNNVGTHRMPCFYVWWFGLWVDIILDTK